MATSTSTVILLLGATLVTMRYWRQTVSSVLEGGEMEIEKSRLTCYRREITEAKERGRREAGILV